MMHVGNYTMKKEHLCLKTNKSGVVLLAGLLKVRDGIQLPQGEAPDNTALDPIAFVYKSLASAEARYSNIERKH